MLKQLKDNKVAIFGGLIFVAITIVAFMKLFPGPQAAAPVVAPVAVEGAGPAVEEPAK